MSAAKQISPRDAISNHSACEADVVQIAKAVGDQRRALLLRVLADDAYSVLELAEIFEITQPALSHHLKLLRQTGLVLQQREGTHIFYRRRSQPEALTAALFAAVDEMHVPDEISAGVARVISARTERAASFFSQHNRGLAQQRELVCAPEIYLPTVIEQLANLAQAGDTHVLEVGPGDGTLLGALADEFTHVVGIDRSDTSLSAAQGCLAGIANVRLEDEDFFGYTASQPFDAIVIGMVAHYLPSPRDLFAQAAKLLTPGGRLVIAELSPHEQAWVREACGHMWLGLNPEDLAGWAKLSGLHQHAFQNLAQRNGFGVYVTSFDKSQA